MIVPPVQTSKVYKLAVEDYYPPFSSLNQQTKQVEGLDVDIGQAVCTLLNIECEFVQMDFIDALHALDEKEVDIVCAAPGTNVFFGLTFLSTYPYFRSTSIFVGMYGAVSAIDPEMLKGLKIGAVRSSSQARYIARTYKDQVVIKEYDEFQDVMNSIVQNEIDLGFVDLMAAYYFLQGDKGLDFDIFGQPADIGDGGVMILLDDRDLLAKLNRAIEALRYTAEYDSITSKYFDFFIF
ncbi:MAG: transporter substrate-binding domain-containing protein [Deltaproteobacteria bacterium]|nr:transporter substrate-binding domain-containing protein [Deltaproteobacteria bacterium]